MVRPTLPDEKRRTKVIQVRLTAAEKQEIERGAANLKISSGALMRSTTLVAVRTNLVGKKD